MYPPTSKHAKIAHLLNFSNSMIAEYSLSPKSSGISTASVYPEPNRDFRGEWSSKSRSRYSISWLLVRESGFPMGQTRRPFCNDVHYFRYRVKQVRSSRSQPLQPFVLRFDSVNYCLKFTGNSGQLRDFYFPTNERKQRSQHHHERNITHSRDYRS